MSIKEVFEFAISEGYTDLQVLIMFLVFEKEVLKMEDDAKELDLYFLEKHHEKMNRELHAYKQKMNISYPPAAYEIKTENGGLRYIYAKTEKQARYIAGRHLIKIDEIKKVDPDMLMNFNGRDMTMKTILKSRKAPEILGGFK